MELDDTSLEAVIEELRHREDLTKEELKRRFRSLVMRTHPDRPGGTERDFIRVREEFARLEEELRNQNARRMVYDGFDPLSIPRELGLQEPISERTALYASISRYMSAGIYAFKIRSNPSLRSRNVRIIKSVLYWGDRYDPHFVKLFSNYLRQQNNFTFVSGEHRVYSFVRKVFNRGVDWALQYQQYGREATAKVARDWLGYAAFIASSSAHPGTESLKALALWFIKELEKPSEKLRTRYVGSTRRFR